MILLKWVSDEERKVSFKESGVINATLHFKKGVTIPINSESEKVFNFLNKKLSDDIYCERLIIEMAGNKKGKSHQQDKKFNVSPPAKSKDSDDLSAVDSVELEEAE